MGLIWNPCMYVSVGIFPDLQSKAVKNAVPVLCVLCQYIKSIKTFVSASPQ